MIFNMFELMCLPFTKSTCNRRMAFGLTSTPATFQRLMNQLFEGEKWKFVHIYLDDILIVSSNFQEHVVHIEQVLKYLSEAGLKLKSAKCAFAQKKIDYLQLGLSWGPSPAQLLQLLNHCPYDH